ncbi:MAG TPA: transglycosylase domain-containing protein [Bacilli bacterium]|nr:transglycosylase domain-containing protein [Bacilli bacterium]
MPNKKNNAKKSAFNNKIQKKRKVIHKKIETKKKAIKKYIKKQTRINLILGSLLILGIIALGIMLIFGLFIIITAPKFNTDLLYNKESSVIYDMNGKVIARLGAENRELVTYDELPQVLVDAIIATEDSRFFQHNGFDIARFTKASLGQLSGDAGAGGASTLTMQVVKNTFTNRNSRGLSGIIRKFTDIYMAVFKVERNYTKEEIIEFYVNSPWLGNGAYGVEQACQAFFGKSVRDISLAEASLLAGIFKAPYSYNPFTNEQLATQRRSIVLNLMVKHGYITKEQKAETEKIPISSLVVDSAAQKLNKYQGFIDTVVEEVIAKTGNDPYNVPMTIYSTMNPEKQDILNNFANGEYYSFVNDVVQTAVAMTDVKNGSIVAVVTGRNQTAERAFNRATMMNRHPGSTAKPIFDYGPLIEYNNTSTYTPILDEKVNYGNGYLKNADGSYFGLLTSRQALYRSRNTAALRAFRQVEKDQIKTFASGLGINFGEELTENLAVGAFDGVSPLELSAAYAAFGRGGYYIAPYSFTKLIYNESGDVFEQKPVKKKVMSEETAYMITSILITGATSGFNGNISVSGTQVASKSGTSTYDAAILQKLGVPLSASADNWMDFYSPDYSISIWYGYDKVSKDYYTTALGGAAVRNKLTTVLGNRVLDKNAKFKKPSGVVSVEVEWETFPPQLPSEFTPSNMRLTELFKKGTEPTDVSKRFSQLSNPTNGSATQSGSNVIISWDPIAKPEAIDPVALQEHFNTYYENYANKYYEKRLAYNNANIGELGYRVYAQDSAGNLVYLGYTTQNTFSYNNSAGYSNFVVKASYSIFTANMSSGLTISGSSVPVTPGGNINYHLKTGASFLEEICLKKDINSTIPYTYNADEVYLVDEKNNIVKDKKPNVNYCDTKENCVKSGISLNIDGKYRITYSYLDDVPIQQIVNVKDSCP